MDSISCTHDNFNFTRTTKNVRKVIKVKQKAKRRAVHTEEEEEDALSQDIDATHLPKVLENYTIYIYNSTIRNKLKAIAEGLGAAVVPDITISTTHVVIEPKGDPKLMKIVKQALSKGIVCASPQWLNDCYEKKAYCSATYYPYAMDKDAYILSADPSDTTPISNPFGTAFIDYDAEENKRANDGQTNLDGFITITRRSEEPSASDYGDLSTSIQDTLDANASYSSDVLDEQEEMAREFYYNSNGETSSVSSMNAATNSTFNNTQRETEEELEEKRKQANERALKAQQVIQQRMAQLEKDKREPPRSKKTLQSGFGERLRIWYGEQDVHQEDFRRKRVVQSTLANNHQQQQRRTTTTSSRRQTPQLSKRPKI